jgi:hypothetical protein
LFIKKNIWPTTIGSLLQSNLTFLKSYSADKRKILFVSSAPKPHFHRPTVTVTAMNILPRTDQLINDLVAGILPQESTLREKHVLREALKSLVRLAKSEQMMEVKNNVRRLTGPITEQTCHPRTRAILSPKGGLQQQFEFMKPNS